MIRFFSNTKLICVLILVCLSMGVALGYFLGIAPKVVQSGISYGFVAFSVLPVSLCMFGVKELNAAYSGIAPYLDAVHRRTLSKGIESRIVMVILVAFAIVVLQVVAAFGLLYFSTNYEYIILGVLFGGVMASLAYGLYVCFSVRRVAEVAEDVLGKKIAEDRSRQYMESFK